MQTWVIVLAMLSAHRGTPRSTAEHRGTPWDIVERYYRYLF